MWISLLSRCYHLTFSSQNGCSGWRGKIDDSVSFTERLRRIFAEILSFADVHYFFSVTDPLPFNLLEEYSG